MLIIGTIFLILTILFGLINLNSILKKKRPPRPSVFLHGAMALFGILVLVGYLASGHTDTLLITALILFLLAAMGGITLLVFDIKKKPIPKLMALGHPFIALSGFTTLVIYVMSQISMPS